MGTEPVPEILENFHTLARLSAREHFIETKVTCYGAAMHISYWHVLVVILLRDPTSLL